MILNLMKTHSQQSVLLMSVVGWLMEQKHTIKIDCKVVQQVVVNHTIQHLSVLRIQFRYCHNSILSLKLRFSVNHNIFVVKAIKNTMTSVEHSYQKSCFGIIFVSTTVSKNTYPITVVRVQKLTKMVKNYMYQKMYHYCHQNGSFKIIL